MGQRQPVQGDRDQETSTAALLTLLVRNPGRFCSPGLCPLTFITEIKTKPFKLKHTFQ